VDISLSDSSVKDDRIELRGCAAVSILWSDADGNIRFKEVELPFSQSIEASGASPDGICISKVYIDKLSALPAENAFGELKTVELDFTCSILSLCTSKCAGEITSDAYSTSCNTENRLCTLRYSIPGEPLSTEETRQVTDKLEPGNVPVCVFGSARVIPSEGGGADMQVTLTVILRSSGGDYSPVKLEDRFGIAVSDPRAGISEAAVRSVNVFAERDRLRVNYTCVLNSLSGSDAEVSYVSEVLISPSPDERTPCSFAICYPEKGESLWDTAKKYRVSRGALMSANGMASPDEPRSFYLIPKRKKPDFSEVI